MACRLIIKMQYSHSSHLVARTTQPSAWKRGGFLHPQNVAPDVENRDRWPLPRYKNLSYYAGDKGRVEHIAGPGRLNQDGYSGHRITLEEMRGCITSQCLVRKPAELSLLPYKFTLKDAAFERW